MTRVVVSGASGQMGSLIYRAVEGEDDLDLVGRFDPAGGGGAVDDPGQLPDADVVVEFTSPDVVMENLAVWQERGLHAVVGTSGFTAERLDDVDALYGTGPPNCFIAPNFSIGAVLMMRFAAEAAHHFSAAEVIELHHDRKADAPSGTAIATAEAIAAVSTQHRAVESHELVPGARGASVEEVPIHAVRLPGLVAHQEVILGSGSETLTIRHDTIDRQAFVPGVLLAIRKVSGLPGVTVGLPTLLDA